MNRNPKKTSKSEELSSLPTQKDYSMLPTEILLMIFDYLRPEDNCMKILTLTCTRFHKICKPRLLRLAINVDQLERTKLEDVPLIKRSYNHVKLSNDFADHKRRSSNKEVSIESLFGTFKKLERLLTSSRMKTTRLEILELGQLDEKLVLRILRFFPMLEVLELTESVSTKRTFYRDLKEAELVDLKSLKKLRLEIKSLNNLIEMNMLKNAPRIEELEIVFKMPLMSRYASLPGIGYDLLGCFEFVFFIETIPHIFGDSWEAQLKTLKKITIRNSGFSTDIDSIPKKFPALEEFYCN
jgi:F-box-like